jgi:hypothetical protein
MHRDLFVVRRIIDGSTPQPAPRFKPVEFLLWCPKQLTRRPKGDKHKVRLARRRAETTMSLARIAPWLRLGSWSNVSNLLRKAKSAKSEH